MAFISFLNYYNLPYSSFGGFMNGEEDAVLLAAAANPTSAIDAQQSVVSDLTRVMEATLDQPISSGNIQWQY